MVLESRSQDNKLKRVDVSSVYAWMPTGRRFESVRGVIRESVEVAGEVIGTELAVTMPAGRYREDLYDLVTRTDILIADLGLSRSALYALGIFDALKRPVVIIAPDDKRIPYAAQHRNMIIYDVSLVAASLSVRLSDALVRAVREPSVFTIELESDSYANTVPPKAFISYSRADRDALRRLQVHLKPLERDGLVDIWADTRVKAGENWKESIAVALDTAAIAVLLVSADFLASEFIVKNELPPLLRAAKEKGTTILPVILKHCRFMAHRELSKFQAINDPGEPLLNLPDVDRELVYTQLVDRIESEVRG